MDLLCPFYTGYMRRALRSHSRRGRSAGIHSMQAGSNASILSTKLQTHICTHSCIHRCIHTCTCIGTLMLNTQSTHARSHMHTQFTHACPRVHTHVYTYMHSHTCICRPTCKVAYICVYTQTPFALFYSFTCFSLPHTQPTPYYPRPGSHLWLILADINKKQC